jgi:hypothetical protein
MEVGLTLSRAGEVRQTPGGALCSSTQWSQPTLVFSLVGRSHTHFARSANFPFNPNSQIAFAVAQCCRLTKVCRPTRTITMVTILPVVVPVFPGRTVVHAHSGRT